MKTFVIIALLAVGFVWFVGNHQGTLKARSTVNYDALVATAIAPADVIYRVKTLAARCGNFSVTYSVPDGTAQKDVTVCPDKDVVDSFTVNGGKSLYLSVQNIGDRNNQTRFSCQILVDGKVAAEVESVGFAKIASCSASTY
jgi:hypothetical protein